MQEIKNYRNNTLALVTYLLTVKNHDETLKEYYLNHGDDYETMRMEMFKLIDKNEIKEEIIKSLHDKFMYLETRIKRLEDEKALKLFNDYLMTMNQERILYTIHFFDVFHHMNVINEDIINYHRYCLNIINRDLLSTIRQLFYGNNSSKTIGKNFMENYSQINPSDFNDWDANTLTQTKYLSHLFNLFDEIKNPYDDNIDSGERLFVYAPFRGLKNDCGAFFIRKVLDDQKLKEFAVIYNNYPKDYFDGSYYYALYHRIKQNPEILKQYPLEWIVNLCLLETG